MSAHSSFDPAPTVAANPSQSIAAAALSLGSPEGSRYAIGEVIARGGMGEVYEARDTVLNRRVAVKLLQARYIGDQDIVRRFLDEARITAQLQHPGVPPVHDLDCAMESRSLRREVRRLERSAFPFSGSR